MISETGIREAVFSTFDIDRISKPMVEVGLFKRIALPDAPREQFTQWHVPAACTRIEQALLVPRDSANGCGALRLVKFHGVEQQVMRSSQRSWDTGGIFDVDVFTTDCTGVYRQLQKYGWTALGEPVDYSEAMFSVRQVVAVGPDGFMLAMIQRYSPPVENQPKNQPMSPIFNSTQMVADFDRAVAFYTQILGFGTRMTFPVKNTVEPGADVLGLPLPYARDADRMIGMFHPPGLSTGVELIVNKSMRGRDFSATCIAPNVGILCLRIPVSDATRYAAEITARGGALYAPPQTFEVAPYGPVTLFSVRSPEGAIVEFFDAPFETLAPIPARS